MRFVFKSLAYPDDVRYVFTPNRWSTDNPHSIHPSLAMYKTFGDGDTAHTPDGPVTIEYMLDCLASLAAEALDNPKLGYHADDLLHSRYTDRDFAFAKSVKYRHGKRRYYSAAERKVSTSQSKLWDKRYGEILPWMDGSVDSIYGVLSSEHDGILECLVLRSEIHDWLLYNYDWCLSQLPGEMFKSAGKPILGHEQAVQLDRVYHFAAEICRAQKRLAVMGEGLRSWIERQKAKQVE